MFLVSHAFNFATKVVRVKEEHIVERRLVV